MNLKENLIFFFKIKTNGEWEKSFHLKTRRSEEIKGSRETERVILQKNLEQCQKGRKYINKEKKSKKQRRHKWEKVYKILKEWNKREKKRKGKKRKCFLWTWENVKIRVGGGWFMPAWKSIHGIGILESIPGFHIFQTELYHTDHQLLVSACLDCRECKC